MTDVPKYHNHMDAQYLEKTLKEIEGLNEDVRLIKEEIRQKYELAKLQGLDSKTMRSMLALRKMDKADVIVQENLRRLYCEALGLVE